MTPTNLSREIDWDEIGEPDCHEDISVRIAGETDPFTEDCSDDSQP